MRLSFASVPMYELCFPAGVWDAGRSVSQPGRGLHLRCR